MVRHRTSCLMVGAIAAWIGVASLDVRLAALGSAPAAADPKAQIEKGRRVAAEVCTTCHTTFGRMIEVHKQTPEQWKDTVYFMISRGAQLMPDEIDSVAAFLASTSASGTQPATQAAGGRGGRGAGAGGRGAGGGGRGQQPANDGAAILQRTCQQCHELAVATNKLASEDWAAVVTRMTTYGAGLTAAERQTLIEYLNQPR
jgi:cytochrome c2